MLRTPGRFARGCFVALLVLLLPGRAARPDEYEDRRERGRCRCHEGKGTWDYLRSPLASPEDDERCGLRIAGGSCRTRPRPPGTSAACWGDRDEECFWRRHAYSWGIRCSECWKPDAADACGELLGGPDAATRTLLEGRIATEREGMRDPLVVVVSPHFYVVTNLHQRVKLRTRKGGLRLMSAHEVAHLYAQRCEEALDDFEHWFGGPIVLPKPMAVFLVNEVTEAWAVSERYFGGNKAHMNYAFNYGDRICQGFCGNGFVGAYEDWHSDNALHGYARHQVGHILFSCWKVTDGFEDKCPRWVWIGAAHFLTKLLEIHQEYATYCYGETSGGIGPRKRWAKRVRDLAGRGMAPIETFFHKSSLSDFAYPDHLRAWSIMDFMMREDRARWLQLMSMLREGTDEGVAFKEVLGITPDQFHERWVERVLGKRRHLGPEPREDEIDPDDPSRRERAELERTQEPEVLAGRLRGLDLLRDRKTAAVVIGHLATPSDLVRETIQLLLRRTTDPDVLAFLREDGLYHPEALVRAGVARALGALRDAEARPVLETLLEDRNWLVRANAAEALGRIADPASRPVLLQALADRDPRAWIVTADAYATFAGASDEASLAMAARLSDKRWQVRLSACRGLARVGTEVAMDALVAQFAEEGGRLKRELHRALRAVAHDDLGPNPATWQRWWREQKKEHGGLPPRPEREGPTDVDEGYAHGQDEGDTRDGPPQYYGRRFFSRSVGFVLDISESMKINMEIEPAEAAQLGQIPTSGRRIDIARHALVDSLARLDPRTHFGIVFFNDQVKAWKDQMVPASAANVAAASRKIEFTTPRGDTNFHGALRAAMGLQDRTLLELRLEKIPDTVFFLTDGRPTHGEIRTIAELVSWLENVNRFAKVDLHVIALGDLNVDAEELAKLAVAGGGELIHVKEKGTRGGVIPGHR